MLDCPACLKPIREIDHQGVLIDTCVACRGVWLDRGELEKTATSRGGDDLGPDDRQRQGRFSRLMGFFG